jgi:hypothetical protein
MSRTYDELFKELSLILVLQLSFAFFISSSFAATAEDPINSEQFTGFLQSYCMDCHNSEDWAGSIAMDTLNLSDVRHDAEIWEKALGRLRGRLMPPVSADQPEQIAIDAIIQHLEARIDTTNNDEFVVSHVPIQRLNRDEFTATIEGLIGVKLDPEQVLPTEIEVEGFNNQAGALIISPAFLEQYLSAVRNAVRLAMGEPVPKFASTFYASDGGTQRSPANNQTIHRTGMPLGTRGGIKFTHVFPTDGEYRFNVLDIDAGLYPRGVETSATLVILIDDEEVLRKKIGGPEDLELADRDGPEGRAAIIAKLSNLPALVTAGPHEVVITYIERSRAISSDLTGGGLLSNMPRLQDGIEVEGPFQPSGLSMSESREKILSCLPSELAEETACAEQIIRTLGTKAFRRQVTEEDIEWLLPYFEAGRAEAGGFDSGITEMVTAMLSSPDFLFRAIKGQDASQEASKLSDLELASRLSFLLWSQGPDQELIDLAEKGRLHEGVVLDEQVDRMLGDPRASALIENFALAWLNLDELEQIEPLDPTFNDGMRKNFETEIRMFLSSVLLEDKPVTELLDANYTFVNEALARHYNIPDVLGSQFRRVELADENRWGLLGKGAVLLRTSYGDRTSPVLRGAWVLDRVLGTPPTPPPPNVETDLSIKEGEKPTTVRQRLEQHRENTSCQSCHGAIDPLGLALENFDVTGKWRLVDEQAKEKIDASTVLPGGKQIEGPVALREHLLSRADQFPQTMTKRLMMYALNREVEFFDMPEVRRIVDESKENGWSFAAILKGVVNSPAFRMQGSEVELSQVASNAH